MEITTGYDPQTKSNESIQGKKLVKKNQMLSY